MVHRRKHRAGLKKRAKILKSQLREVEGAIATKEAARRKPKILAVESGNFIDPRAFRRPDLREQPEILEVDTPELVDLTIDDDDSTALNNDSFLDDASLHSAETYNYNPPDIELVDLTDDYTDNQNSDFYNDLTINEELHSIHNEEPPEFQEAPLSDQIAITEWFTRIDTYARTVFLSTHNS